MAVKGLSVALPNIQLRGCDFSHELFLIFQFVDLCYSEPSLVIDPRGLR